MTERNSYLITKALNSYLKGSVFIAISGHLITTTDAIVVSWLIGPKALSAVNVVIPILTLFISLMILFGTGGVIASTKAMGVGDQKKVNLSFSSSFLSTTLIGVAAGVATYKLSSFIVRILSHGDPSVQIFAYRYLDAFCYAIPLMIVTGALEDFIRADGNSKLVRIAVVIGVLLNLGLDILLVGYTQLGIAGAAWSSAIFYLVIFIVCLFHFFSKHNTLKWSLDFKDYIHQIAENCRLGFSTSLNNTLLAVCLYVINIIMIKHLGSEGIYCWAVSYQIFVILQMLLTGIDSGIFVLGGILSGEDDVIGLKFLYRRCLLYLLIGVLLLSALIIIFPELFGKMFGNTGQDRLHLLPGVLKIFSLFLLPYAMITQVRSVYTITGQSSLSLFFSLMPFALMMLLAYLTSIFDIKLIWWSFPVSSWSLLILLFIITLFIHFHNKNLRIFSLIPKKESGEALNTSIGLASQDVTQLQNRVIGFLKKEGVNDTESRFIGDKCHFVVNRIIQNFHKDNITDRFFDIHVRIKGSNVIATIKDDGKRLSPEEESQLLSEMNTGDINLIPQNNGTRCDVNYYFMNGQNIYALDFSY